MPKGKNSEQEQPDANEGKSQIAAQSSTETAPASADAGANKKHNRLSWRGGSWRGKAIAVAEIAKESIPGNTASEIASRPKNEARNPSHRLSQSLGSPGKSKASPASATPLTVQSDASSEDRTEGSSEKKASIPQEGEGADEKKTAGEEATSETPGKDGSAESHSMQEQPQGAHGWRGWWARPRDEGLGAGQKDAKGKSTTGTTEDRSEFGRPATTLYENATRQNQSQEGSNKDATVKPDSTQEQSASKDDAPSDLTDSPKPQRSSWFGLWGTGTQGASHTEESSAALQRKASGPKGLSVEPSPTNVDVAPEPTNNASATGETVKSQLTTRPASGSWAFWSRERPAEDSTSPISKSDQKGGDVGELAVSGTDSQSKPRPAQLSEKDDASQEPSKKRQRPQSSEPPPLNNKKKAAGKLPALSSPSHPSHSDSDLPSTMQQSVLRTTIDPPKPKPRAASKEKQAPKAAQPPPNAIFPAFSSYPLAQPSSYLSRLSRFIPYTTSPSEPKHLYRSTTAHRIHRALAIGVHGYFPAALIQKVLGPPTGTSIKFADSAAAAIQQYCSLHAYTADIDKVALEGEGTVDQRIESLWKLLLNWIDAIRKSDFILVACHSQGVPVAVGLVARLLSFGCVQKDARIGICAMAGVNQGPFASYQSRFLPVGSSGAELFQFARPRSGVSQAYSRSLNTCLRHHVRVLYVGSLDDQLVSLESSTFSSIGHPYVSRAVFVDGREHPATGDFLTRLVGFGLKLRNLGVSDHGLIKELSGPLAGSLYTGEGHSRIYEEEAVYDLAVRLAVETDTLDGSANPHLEVGKKVDSGEANPFFLPWALRGVLEEDVVKRDMKGETDELLGLFERWRPQSKMLKDVRFRLEAVRSKL